MKRFSLSFYLDKSQPSFRRLALSPSFRVAASVAAGVGIVAHHNHTSVSSGPQSAASNKLRLPLPVVQAVAGAIGEIAQILVLYPLDTVKVICQAQNQGAKEVVAQLLRSGLGVQLLHKLYAGAAGAALCSVLVGAVHYVSYSTALRHLQTFLLQLQTCAARAQHNSPVYATACLTVHMPTTAAASDYGSDEAAPTRTTSQGSAVSSTEPTSRGTLADSATPAPVLSDGLKTTANVLAALFGALATAVVESPVELFRHNAQAGLAGSNFLAEMFSVLKKQGPAGLYWGFLPHCFEAWPHDVSELAVYGATKDMFEGACKPESSCHGLVSGLSQDVMELSTGAAAGAAAVVISHPMDSIKTHLQTRGTNMAGRGLLGSAALFLQTGKELAAKEGFKRLYVGVAPRLLQQVPSAMIGWWAIEASQRVIRSYVQVDAGGSVR